ncbi:ATP-binding protein [Kosakonia oryzae]|uniref:histidine kinase n=1 Tax=Kosakonia oryzae TaxID=497725 RepID=A0AA94H1D8_9ENTR|nr:ATP-binding protein [Kosakonia oryzae]ANI83460.1 HAMP domain-containing protein [Kosakonia oryzae]SFB97459.1 Signal transduction histidine kinase [Kosakonia oryzae]
MPSGKTSRFNSLSFKILLAFITGVLLSIALLILLGMVVKERLPGMDLTDYTRALARQLQFDAHGQPIGFREGADYPLWIYSSLEEELAYRVLDADGKVVLMSPGAQHWPPLPQLTAPVTGDFKFQLQGAEYGGTSDLYFMEGKRWFIQVSASSRIIDFLHRGFALPFIRFGIELFSLVLLVVFGLCAWVTLAWSLRPLRQASAGAATISPRSLDARLPTAGVPTEILPLIDSFNQALARLETGFRNQQDFLAKAAHELKTPLTLIRAEVELMSDCAETRELLLARVEHLSRQVQQLLILAEASEPLSYHFAPVDVADVARDSARFLQRIAEEARVNLTLTFRSVAVVWNADRGALFTLLKNLMENAIQHAPAGSDVHIEIHAQAITLRDWGPGVAGDELPLLFTRFWRGAHRRDSGAGLGLAICQEIAVAHGWSLTAENAQPGLRLRLCVTRA